MTILGQIGVLCSFDSTLGLLATRADAGGTTTYNYDTWGQLSAIIYPCNLGTNSLVNNRLGEVMTNINPQRLSTVFQYNLRRQPTNTIAPTNLTTRIVYDAVGNVSTAKDALGNVTSNSWSASRHLLATTLPLTPQGTPVISNNYDTRDWLASTVNPLLQTTRFTNDLTQRLIGVIDPLLRTSTFAYDNDGRRTNATDAALETTLQNWDVRGQLTQSTDAATNRVGHGYNSAGNAVLLTNRNGNVWQFGFDAANRLTDTVTPLFHTNSASYDHRGLVQATQDAMGQTTTLGYDGRARLTTRTDNVAATTYQYDFNSNLTNLVEGGQTLQRQYDAYDRLTRYQDAAGNLIQYRYDANGNLTNLVYPGNRTVTYA